MEVYMGSGGKKKEKKETYGSKLFSVRKPRVYYAAHVLLHLYVLIVRHCFSPLHSCRCGDDEQSVRAFETDF